MHILQVTLGFYPAQAWGGPVKIVHQNGRELARRGHQVTVYCTNLLDKRRKIRPETFEQEMEGMRVVYLNTWNLPWWPGTLGPFWLPDLTEYLRREIKAYDVVHINGYRSPLTLSVARAAAAASVPIVTQPHGTLPIIVNSFAAKRIYDWLWGASELRNISALIAGQESERQQALARGVPEHRIEIVPNGIDPSQRDGLPEVGSIRRRLGLDPLRPLILFLARINKKKGADMLIEAFARLEGMDAQLLIAGPDDGQSAEVEGLVQKYGLAGKVRFSGLLTGKEVLAAFQDADLFVLPCRADTFPVAIVESCLMDRPMVVTDRCEIAHLIRDRVGEVVPFDPAAFADAMKRVLTDRRLYEKYRAGCRELVESTFSIRAVADRMEAIYERAIAERRRI